MLLPDGDDGSGRIARWRARAEHASDSYQQRIQIQPILGLPLAFIARYTARQGVLLASATAFRLFLWLMPLALLTAGVLAVVTDDEPEKVESATKAAGVTGTASQQVVTALRDGNRSWVVAVITGAVLFVWATRTLIRNLSVVNAHAWGAPLPHLRQKDVMVISATFAGAWLVLFAFVLLVHRLSRAVPGGAVLTIFVQGWAVGALWLIVSMRLPDRRQTWLDLLPGAVLVGFGLAVMNTIGRIYLPARIAHSSAIYGSLGIASVLLVWLLLIGQLIVSSALINTVWFDFRASRRGEPLPPAPGEVMADGTAH